MDEGFFTYRPANVEPAAERLLLHPARLWYGGGFPAREKCPAPTRRAGHFRVRLSGRYNALYLAAPWGLQGVRPGTPRDPVLRLRLRRQRALVGPQPAPLCRCFCRLSLGVGVYPSWAAKTRLRADGGRKTGVITETKTAPGISRRRCHTLVKGQDHTIPSTLPYRVNSVCAHKTLTECSHFSGKSALMGKIPKALHRQGKRRKPQ